MKENEFELELRIHSCNDVLNKVTNIATPDFHPNDTRLNHVCSSPRASTACGAAVGS